MNLIDQTLLLAKRVDKPVVIVYQGKKEISQRRVYIRKIAEDKITVYCTKKKAIRVFDKAGVLSAMIAEE